MKLLILPIIVFIFSTGQSFSSSHEVRDTTLIPLDTLTKPPLYVLKIRYEFEIVYDSTDSNFNALSALELEWIKSITIYKNDEAVKKYGKRAENGVIIVEIYRKYLKMLPDGYREKFHLASN